MSHTTDKKLPDRFKEALNELFRSTKGMHENVEPALDKFKRDAFPYSENALNLMVSSGWVDEEFHRKTEGGRVLEDIYNALFSSAAQGEREMPDRAKVAWDGLCSCYILKEDAVQR